MFNDQHLEWHGKAYVIPANKMLQAIAQVESIVTATELAQYAVRNVVPFSLVAQAYGELLRFAGCDVSDEEVYEGIFVGDDSMAIAVETLIAIMTPPQRAKKKTVNGSARRSRPSSAAGSSGRPTSGNSRPKK